MERRISPLGNGVQSGLDDRQGRSRNPQVKRDIMFERATAKDVGTFLALECKAAEVKTWGPLSNADGAAREIRENTLWLIKKEGEDGSVYISNVAVDPVFRRRGIARLAMKRILDTNKSARRIDLVTHPENERALNLYLSLGFKIESRDENRFGDGEPRLVLARKNYD